MKKQNILPTDTNAALQEVVNVIQKMGDIYKTENDILRAHDSNAFLIFQDKKIAVAHEYNTKMGEMIARKNEISNADPSVKERLKKMQADFAVLSKQNLEAIERMQRCTERLGNSIRNAAVKTAQTMRTYSYGENGTIPKSAKNKIVSSGLSETA